MLQETWEQRGDSGALQTLNPGMQWESGEALLGLEVFLLQRDENGGLEGWKPPFLLLCKGQCSV